MKTFRHAFRGVALAVLATTVATVVVAQELRMSVGPVFEGLRSGRSAFPLRVLLENPGPAVQGAVRVLGEASETMVPVELPQGSRKALTVVARLPFGQTSVVLESNRGRLRKLYENPAGSLDSENVVGVVTDTPGLMGFLRDRRSESGGRAFVGDAYVSAENLPDREIGLEPLSALVLGEGAERLGDAQVAAIERWVAGGGSLVFMGGASTPVLADGRWDHLLPVTTRGPRVIPGTTIAPLTTSRPPGEDVTVTAATPKAGAKSRFPTVAGPLIVEWRVGLGKVTFLAFNLSESPLTGWEGRRDVLMDVADPYLRASNRMVYGLREDDPTLTSVYPSTVPGGPPPSVVPPGYSDPDPFQTRLPEAGQIVLILGVYFVLVVPVSFIGLRRIGRGELAWITAPILSLACAGVLFYSARELYRAGLSRIVTGRLLAVQGTPGARLYGTAQLFFPTGGSYDLSFARADWIAPAVDNRYGTPTSQCTVLDLDGMRVPTLAVSNLSFRRFDFRQDIDVRQVLEVRFVPARFRNSRERYRGIVRNTSPFVLKRPILYHGRVAIVLGPELVPGQEFAIDLDPTTIPELPQPDRIAGADPRAFVVTADIASEGFGPQIGVHRASSVGLLYVGRVAEGGS